MAASERGRGMQREVLVVGVILSRLAKPNEDHRWAVWRTEARRFGRDQGRYSGMVRIESEDQNKG